MSTDTNNIHSTSPDAYLIVFPYEISRTKIGEPYSSKMLETKHFFVRSDLLSVQTYKSKGQVGTFSAILAPRVNWKSRIQPGSWIMIFMRDEDLTHTENATLNNSTDKGLKMLGIVRSVRAIESMDESGRRQLRYEISGNDFQSIFDSKIYVNPDLRVFGDQKSGPIVDAVAYFGQEPNKVFNPSEIASIIIETFLGKKEELGRNLSQSGGRAGGVYGIPPEVAKRLTGDKAPSNLFVNILNQAIQPGLFGQLAFQPHVADRFDCWSLLAAYQNPVLNELYTELLPVNLNGTTRLIPSVVLRAIPFSSPNMSGAFKFDSTESDSSGKQKIVKNNLTAPLLKMAGRASVTKDSVTYLYTSKEIKEHHILNMNYGKSDAERFNFFYISGNYSSESPPYTGLVVKALAETDNQKTADGKTTFVSQNAMGDLNAVARYGLRPYFDSTNYVTLSVSTAPLVVMNKIVRDMWHESYLYENGTVSIVGSNDYIPVGTNIVFKDRNWIAHVEAVSNTYSVSPEGMKSFHTTISFVRLQKTDGTPIDFAADAEDTKDYQQNITVSYVEDVNTKLGGKK